MWPYPPGSKDQLHGDLREHVLADDEDRRSEPAADRDAEVPDDRRVGHTEHEIGRWAALVKEAGIKMEEPAR